MIECIWCRKKEPKVAFKNKAHSIPASLGGIKICKEVCDDCNHYFGSRTSHQTSIEVVLKELFNISRHLLLNSTGEQAKIKRYKSEFFNINWKSRAIRTKPRYKLKSGFQKDLARLFKRGVYKIFLEERSRVRGDAYDNRFNFIREFARYDLGEYPLYYFEPRRGAVFFSSPDAIHPELRFSEHHDMLMTEFQVYEIAFIGHTFAIPTSITHNLVFDNYVEYCRKKLGRIFNNIIEVEKFEQIDFTFKHLK